MPVKLFGKLVKAFAGTAGIADAVDIETTGNSNVQSDLSSLTNNQTNLQSSVLNWNFDGTTIDTTDPGATNLALNNAAKASATVLTFNTTSNINGARFDEFLDALSTDERIFVWQRSSTDKSALYRVTGDSTLTSTKVDVPIALERSNGGEFTDNEELNVLFFSRGHSLAIKLRSTTVDATDQTSFENSLTGLTLALGDAFKVATAGEPFTGSITKVAVNDIMVATASSPSATNIAHWAIIRKPDSLPVSFTSDLFLQQISSTSGVFGFTSNVQIDRDNVEANYRNVIENHGTAPDLTSLESKVNALFPLTPDVDILTDWANIYEPARAIETVNTVQGYSSVVDFRSVSDRYEEAGITYTASAGVSDYSGLTDDLHRAFGFRVDGPANQTLLWINDGGTYIPFVDMTSGGNFRVNNFTPARTTSEVVQNDIDFATLSSGTGTIAVGGGASTYTIPDYPANTSAQSRVLTVEFDAFESGADTLSGGAIEVDIPDTDIVSTNDVTHTFFLGFPRNRSVTATFRVATRVDGPNYVVDITLLSAPANITFSINNVNVPQNYTATTTIARVDEYLILQDELGDHTFTGENELLMVFHPIHPIDDGEVTTMDVVPVVVNTSTGVITELNDSLVKIPSPVFDEIRTPDTIEFRTFLPNHFLIHRDLSHLLADRNTKWCYALARLDTVTEHAVNTALDLAAGTKVDGVEIPRSGKSLVLQATDDSTDLRNTITLPANYTNFDYLHITEIAGGERRSVTLSVPVLSSSDLGSSELIRSQGNTDFLFNNITRVLTPEPTATTLYRVELFKF